MSSGMTLFLGKEGGGSGRQRVWGEYDPTLSQNGRPVEALKRALVIPVVVNGFRKSASIFIFEPPGDRGLGSLAARRLDVAVEK